MQYVVTRHTYDMAGDRPIAVAPTLAEAKHAGAEYVGDRPIMWIARSGKEGFMLAGNVKGQPFTLYIWQLGD